MAQHSEILSGLQPFSAAPQAMVFRSRGRTSVGRSYNSSYSSQKISWLRDTNLRRYSTLIETSVIFWD